MTECNYVVVKTDRMTKWTNEDVSFKGHQQLVPKTKVFVKAGAGSALWPSHKTTLLCATIRGSRSSSQKPTRPQPSLSTCSNSIAQTAHYTPMLDIWSENLVTFWALEESKISYVTDKQTRKWYWFRWNSSDSRLTSLQFGSGVLPGFDYWARDRALLYLGLVLVISFPNKSKKSAGLLWQYGPSKPPVITVLYNHTQQISGMCFLPCWTRALWELWVSLWTSMS